MSPLHTAVALFITVITSSVSSPIDEQRSRWLEVMGVAEAPGIYVGPGPVDMEFSGDFENGLPGGLQGSGDQASVTVPKQEFHITDLLIAVDHQNNEESFLPSSSSSSISSIIEASVSEYDGIDSDFNVHFEKSHEYEGDNELGLGGPDPNPNDVDHDSLPVDSNAIPDAFQNGANAELAPGRNVAINKVSTKAKVRHEENEVQASGDAVKDQKSAISKKGQPPPNMLKYTAVIGVVMVAGAVGMGAFLSAMGLGAVRLVKRIRKPAVVEA